MLLRRVLAAVFLVAFSMPALAQLPAASPTPAPSASDDAKSADKDKDKEKKTGDEKPPEQFHGVQEDIESVGEFIRLYATRYARWASPKFLAGESYGTTRAAGLSGYLQDRYGMYLNGIVLISSILNFQTTDFNVGNDLPYVLYLPSYTATAWYHKRLPADLRSGTLAKAVAESETFALNEYSLALTRGSQLPAAERQAITKKYARLTGPTSRPSTPSITLASTRPSPRTSGLSTTSRATWSTSTNPRSRR